MFVLWQDLVVMRYCEVEKFVVVSVMTSDFYVLSVCFVQVEEVREIRCNGWGERKVSCHVMRRETRSDEMRIWEKE